MDRKEDMSLLMKVCDESNQDKAPEGEQGPRQGQGRQKRVLVKFQGKQKC